jgi:GMP synthase-like glutamine amidotransferase
MTILYLQHVDFEDPGMITIWAASRGITMRPCRLYLGDPFPPQDSFDGLLIMGGPMGVHDEKEFSWLSGEKRFIEETIKEGKPVLGICLGAQLLADVLGGEVYPNKEKEIGWFPVSLTTQGKKSELLTDIPDNFTVFQWHGDTFSLPAYAVHLVRSEACEVQAFSIGNTILGLQFHLELGPGNVEGLTDHAAEDITDGPWIQSAQEMITAQVDYHVSHDLMQRICDTLYIGKSVDDILD